MPRTQSPVPTLTRHKATNRAVVRLSGQDHYLGPWPAGQEQPDPDVRAAYDRLIAEWLAGGRRPLRQPDRTPGERAPAGPSVNEVLLSFWRHAEVHYRRDDGTPTSELADYRLSLRPLRAMYGTAPAAEFGPKKLAAVREGMIASDISRKVVNQRVDRIKRVFKWAASEELVPVAVHQALRTLSGLQAGRSKARETAPVLPVPVEHYEATLPHLPRGPRAMVELQRWTGMRPGEVCGLKLEEIDRTGPTWLFRPARHKTRHHGRTRAVPIGPRGQAVLTAFAAGRLPAPPGAEAFDYTDPTARTVAADLFDEHGRPVDAALLRDQARPVVLFGGSLVDPAAHLFNPARDREERFAAMRRARKTKVQPTQVNRRKPAPGKLPGTRYTSRALAKAVGKACKKAGVPHWHPNQLRHLRATEVRVRYGLEAAQVLLGHSRADVTQVYAERDEALAARVAGETG